MSFRKKNISQKKGFTLIEMIVVIAMIITLTAIVLFNSSKLNSAVRVANSAYEISLMVHETQVAGLAVRASSNTFTANTFSVSHGIHFDVNTPTKVVLFADLNGNSTYDLGEMTQEFTMQKRGGTIFAICGKQISPVVSAGVCSPSNETFVSAASADVVFTRPNPEAFFKIKEVEGGSAVDHSGGLVINVGYLNDVCKNIIIEKTGAVQVDTANCAPIN